MVVSATWRSGDRGCRASLSVAMAAAGGVQRRSGERMAVYVGMDSGVTGSGMRGRNGDVGSRAGERSLRDCVIEEMRVVEQVWSDRSRSARGTPREGRPERQPESIGGCDWACVARLCEHSEAG